MAKDTDSRLRFEFTEIGIKTNVKYGHT